jgi:hypothetical protein
MGFGGSKSMSASRKHSVDFRPGEAVRLIPGAHDTILQEPGVRRLAAALVERLDESADCHKSVAPTVKAQG